MQRQKSRFYFEAQRIVDPEELATRTYWQSMYMQKYDKEGDDIMWSLYKDSIMRNWVQRGKSGTLIQNGPHSGQGIRHIDGSIVPIHDFVGTFDVIDRTANYLYGTVCIERLDTHTKQFHFCNNKNNYQLRIQECNSQQGGIGAGCWLSSVAMLAWLTQNAEAFEGKRVMEMGCGIGLCSLGLSLITDATTLIVGSDYKQALADTFEKNVGLNNLDSSKTAFKLLDWAADCNDGNDCNDCNDGNDAFDVIIATDCIYKSTAELFKQAVFKHLAPNGTLIFMNPYGASRPGVDTFIYSLAECGEVETRHVEICMGSPHGSFSLELMFVIYTHSSS
jgi:predicted nicotinamide N-methyase